MKKVLIYLYHFFEKQRVLFFSVFTLCFLLAGYFASKVKFEEDISKILPKDKKVEKLNEIFQNSKFLDKLVVMVSFKDTTAVQPDSLVAYSDILTTSVQGKLSPYIAKINARVDDELMMNLYSTINENLPIYLQEKDYKTIDSLIADQKIKPTLEQDLRTLASPAGIALKKMIAADPVGISFIGLKKLQQLQYDENFELYDSYVLTKDRKHLMLFITPKFPPNNTGKNAEFLKGLDAVIDSLGQKEYPAIQTDYFGATAVSVGNALQLRKDSLFTQGITVIFLIVFLGFYFRKKRAPCIILIPVLFGSLFALAAIYFIRGGISVIALGAGSIVLGIAVNYSLHVFNHFRHTRNIEEVIKDLAQPLTIGSFTTIGGFLCLEFVKSEMLKDLGLFAAFSLIGASLCSLIFLPHFISSGKKKQEEYRSSDFSRIDKLASYEPEYNKVLVALILVITIGLAFMIKRVGFESDMLKMNYMSADLKRAEASLNKINAYALQSVYLVTEGNTFNEALKNNEQLTAKIDKLKEAKVVNKYAGITSLIISDSLQRARINYWNNYWTTEKRQHLLSVLIKEGAALGFKPIAFDKFRELLNKNYQPVGDSAMSEIRTGLLSDYVSIKPDKTTIVTLVKVSQENKQKVYNSFEHEQHVTVVDKQYLTAKFVEIVNSDFTSIAIMTSILVFIVLLITYGRIELTLVSFIPMFISWIWILGLMGLLGIQFNIVNIIISALIFGLGDDYSLFIMDGLLKEYKTGQKTLTSYKSSIFLSAITTIAGLGVLIFARHPALRSIAVISIIGIVCVVLMSQILIPFFFNLLIKSRIAKSRFPWTMSGFLKSVFVFAFFTVGSIILTIIGLLLSVIPFGREKVKLLYHHCISKFLWSLMHIMGSVKKKIINPDNEDFSKPAIIIANHQSFLDTFSFIMQHPKLILFTNQWVWNSPIFGAVVRMADYYPAADGIENSLPLIKESVKHGYSILIFPEGGRSTDGTIKRFHKGAFYLAQELKLDILPALLHGTGYTMAKNDFLLKDGSVTIKYLPRIKPEDAQYGEGYSERSKNIGRYFREQFALFSKEIEQPRYFREQLIYNYLYKGPVLEWYMKIKTSLEDNYELFNQLLPKEGQLLDIGCGYGFLAYMLQFVASERIITGIDYDEEKIATASHCFSKNDNIHFFCADALQFPFERYNAIILADMLHYLSPQQQKELLLKCMHSLTDDGLIVLRDGNSDLAKRHKRTKLTELFSTRLLSFNKTTEKGLSFLSGKEIKAFMEDHGMSCEEIDNTKFTSNVIFIIRKKASD